MVSVVLQVLWRYVSCCALVLRVLWRFFVGCNRVKARDVTKKAKVVTKKAKVEKAKVEKSSQRSTVRKGALRTTHFVPAGAKLLIEESNADNEPVFEFATHEEIADARALLSKDKVLVAAAKGRIEGRKSSRTGGCVSVVAIRKPSILCPTKEARESRQAARKKRKQDEAKHRERVERARRDREDEEVLQAAIDEADRGRPSSSPAEAPKRCVCRSSVVKMSPSQTMKRIVVDGDSVDCGVKNCEESVPDDCAPAVAAEKEVFASVEPSPCVEEPVTDWKAIVERAEWDETRRSLVMVRVRYVFVS
jgi:hypothetical protein